MNLKRSLFALTIVLVGCSPTLGLLADRNFPSRPAQYSTARTFGIGFKTSDGIELVADTYLPVGPKTAPTILVRIPFTATFGNKLRSQVIAQHWASRGYAVVIQGTRGRYKSGGKFYPLVHERADGIETLKWLARQPWFDGRLAMWGGSSFGHTQWAIADQQDPGPTALSIQIASTSFRKMFYPGQAFSLESAVYWAIRSRGDEDREVEIESLKHGVEHLPIIEADDIAIGDTDFYNDWVSRNDTEFWDKVDGNERTTTLKAPVLLTAGWFDPFLPTQLDDFVNVRQHAAPAVAASSRLVIGPWAHAQSVMLPDGATEVPYRSSSVTLSTPWFDNQFGLAPALSPPSPVTIYVMGENRWRDENEWPLARTQYLPFYLASAGFANSSDGNGSLQTPGAPTDAPYDRYVYNPLDPVPTAGGAMLSARAGIALQNEIERREDVLVYSTPPLPKRVEVTGPIRAVLFVATDAPSTDFTAKLVDVHPDGSAFNVSDGIVRRSFNQNVPSEIEIELWPTSNVFLEGHRIRLEVSSSNFPRYDRNLNTGESAATATRSLPAHQTVFHSTEFPSRLILPIIPR